MSTPYIGEIRAVAFTFAPVGWELCAGQLLLISDYSLLFDVLSTTFGGDGQNNFALPDLRGRTRVHWGSNPSGEYILGTPMGAEGVTLSINSIPTHSHTLKVEGVLGTLGTPVSNYMAGSTDGQYAANGSLATGPILGIAGSSQPHENRQPFQAINFIIATEGIYPSQS